MTIIPPSYDISQYAILFTKQYTHSTKKNIKIQPKSMDLWKFHYLLAIDRLRTSIEF